MAKKKEKDNIVSEIKETTINDINKTTNYINKSILLADTHIQKAFQLIKENKKDEAKYEIDLAYNLDENNANIYLAKLFLKFNLKSFDDLEKRANTKIVSSSFFKASFELGDKELKTRLNEIIENVEYKQVEINLETADIEQLLKHLRTQKQKDIDYTYTISLILSMLYRDFRYIDKDFIDENKDKDNFISILKKMESSFQYYLDILYHFDDIVDIKDIIAQCISDHRAVLNYNLIILKDLIDSTTNETKLNEIKEYIEIAYLHHEADELLNDIKPKLKNKKDFSLGALLASTFSFFIVLGFTALAIITASFANNGPVTINGVTYKKNENNGYTIIDYDFLDSTVIFQNEIDGLEVNEISSGIFEDSNIYKIENFPNAITNIPENEFRSCDYLFSFSFYNNESSLLNKIGKSAFEDCTTLDTFIVNKNVEIIEENAFKNTPNLINLTKESEVDFDESYIGLSKRNITIEFNNDIEDYEGSYYSWDKINLDTSLLTKTYYDFLGFNLNDSDFVSPINNKITINCNGYYYLSLKATYDFSNLITDEYGVSYKLSDDKSHYIIYSYSGNDSNEVYLKDNFNGIKVSELDKNCFANNRRIEKIYNFPNYIETIKESSFSGCTSLTDFKFNDDSDGISLLKTIENNAFYNCSSLKSFILPTSVSYLGDNSFKGCDELLSFKNSYEWENEDNHNEAIRVGFEGRKYYLRDENGTILEEDYYYICEEVIKLYFNKIGDYYKPYVFETNSGILYSSYETNKTYFIYLVENKSTIDLTIKYDRLYPSSNYSLELNQKDIIKTSVKRNDVYKLKLSAKLIDLSTNKEVDEKYTISYEITSISSSLIGNINGDVLEISKKNINQIATNETVTYRAYISSKVSDEKLICSITEGTIAFYLY